MNMTRYRFFIKIITNFILQFHVFVCFDLGIRYSNIKRNIFKLFWKMPLNFCFYIIDRFFFEYDKTIPKIVGWKSEKSMDGNNKKLDIKLFALVSRIHERIIILNNTLLDMSIKYVDEFCYKHIPTIFSFSSD